MPPSKRRSLQPDPAPGELRTLQAFVNTADLKAKLDELRSPRELERWCVGHGLLGADVRLSAADLRRTVEVREGLRTVLAANNRGRIDPAVFDRLEEAIGEARYQVRFDNDGTARFEAVTPGIDAALGKLIGIMMAAQLTDRWPRFKACADKGCGAAFFDPSGRAKWCTRQCGDRVRAKMYRRSDKYKKNYQKRPTVTLMGEKWRL